MSTDNKPTLGSIGLGNMGNPMVRHLLDQGFSVNICARNPDRLTDLVAAGATAQDNMATVASASDIIFTCVTDTNAMHNVVFGEGGLAEGAAADKAAAKILVDMSSIEPGATVEMGARLKAETGMGWVDAPISGTPTACREGKLTIMAGGSEEDFNAALPALGQLAGRLTHMGPAGAGQTTKLVNQTLVGGTLALVAEAIRFAEDSGVDATKIPIALAGGRADSPVLQEWGTRMTVQDYAPTATVNIMVKDLHTVARIAQTQGTPMPVSGTAANMFTQANRMGFGNLDVCAVKKVLDKP